MYFFGQDKVKDCLFNPSVYSSFSVICEILWLEFEGKGDRGEDEIMSSKMVNRYNNMVIINKNASKNQFFISQTITQFLYEQIFCSR